MKPQTIITRQNKNQLKVGDNLLLTETYKGLDGKDKTKEVSFTVTSLRNSKNGLRVGITSNFGYGARDFDPEFPGMKYIYTGE